MCSGLGVSVSYLDGAVLAGIHARLEHMLDRDHLAMQLREQLAAEAPPEDTVVALEARLAETRQKISRLVGVLSAGAEDLRSVREALVGLERERERCERELEAARARTRTAGPDQVVDELLAGLERVRELLEDAEPEERKAFVRLFVRDITIDKAKRQATLRWYRLPQVDGVSVKLVELRGLEPLTPRLPALCSPN